MARIKGKDIYLKDDDQIYFGNHQEAGLWYDDNELRLDHTISGTWATQGYHLIRKDQVDYDLATLSGTIPYGFLDLLDTPTSYSGYGETSYFVKVKDDESGLEFSQALTGATSSGVPPDGTSLWFNSDPDWNTFFLYDPNRGKWLSVMRHTYLFTYAGAGSGQYMSIGNVTHSSAYYYIPRTGVITGIMASSEHAQNPSKILEFRDDGTTISGGTFQYSNWEYNDLAANINVEPGMNLQLYITSAGLSIRNPIVFVEVVWRYDV